MSEHNTQDMLGTEGFEPDSQNVPQLVFIMGILGAFVVFSIIFLWGLFGVMSLNEKDEKNSSDDPVLLQLREANAAELAAWEMRGCPAEGGALKTGEDCSPAGAVFKMPIAEAKKQVLADPSILSRGVKQPETEAAAKPGNPMPKRAVRPQNEGKPVRKMGAVGKPAPTGAAANPTGQPAGANPNQPVAKPNPAGQPAGANPNQPTAPENPAQPAQPTAPAGAEPPSTAPNNPEKPTGGAGAPSEGTEPAPPTGEPAPTGQPAEEKPAEAEKPAEGGAAAPTEEKPVEAEKPVEEPAEAPAENPDTPQ